MREFSPDIFQRLEQASQARGLLIAQAREASLSRHTIVNIPPPESRQRLSARRLPRFYIASATSIALMIAACGPTPAPKPINPETKIPSTQTIQKTSLENFLPFKGLSRFTGGPHDSFRKGGVRDGFDVAPDVQMGCSPGVTKFLGTPPVVASASGTVSKVGNEKDRTDPYHSIVEIKKEDDSIVGAMHLGPIQVSVKDKVIGGETVIGKVSCEVPKGGNTEAMHVHVYVRDKNGNQIPIEGRTFSGYTAHAAAKESDGTMVREDGQVITAINGKRCGPDEGSIKACDGKRNDLNTGAVLGETVKVAPLPTIAAAKPTPSVEKPVQPGFTRYPSTVNPYQIDSPNGYYISANNRAKTDVFVPHDFWSSAPSATILIMTEPINSWVNLEAHKIKASNQSPFNQAQNPPRFVPKLVDGRDGWIFEHINPGSSMSYARMVVFVYKDLGWTVTLNASRANSATIETDRQLLDRMVSSIKLR